MIIFNQFFDAIAVNTILTNLYGIDCAALKQKMLDYKLIPNILAFTTYMNEFNSALGQDNYENYLAATINHFRQVSLRYKTHPNYIKLVNTMKANPFFGAIWERQINERDTQYQTGESFQIHHPEYGIMLFSAMENTYLTSTGEIYSMTYAPANEFSRKYFTRNLSNQVITMLPHWSDWKGMSYQPMLLQENLFLK